MPRPRPKPRKTPPKSWRFPSCPGCGQLIQITGKDSPRYQPGGFLTPHLCDLRTLDMTTGDIDTFLGATDVPRDRWGRPLILTPDGKRKGYTRCTTFVGCLEDTYNLAKWQQRMVALGLAQRDDLLLSVSAHSDNKGELDKICDAAKEAAAASSGATKGTALHRICERLDSGEPNVDIPTAAKADIKAYQAAVAGVRWTHIERITVLDDLEIAGTPDRIGVAPGETRAKVWDLKTGSIDYGMGKIAMQLAVYAHSQAYDVDTGERTDLDVDLDKAVVIHLPAGEGECRLVEVDIAAGWEAVQIAAAVRDWRKRKNLSRDYTFGAAVDLFAEIHAAADEIALKRLWSDNRAAWTADHTAAAALRKQHLAAAS